MSEVEKRTYTYGEIEDYRFDAAERVAAAVLSSMMGYSGVDYLLKTYRKQNPRVVGKLWVEVSDALHASVGSCPPAEIQTSREAA